MKTESKQQRERRYYLHGMVRKFAVVKARERQVNISERIMNEVSDLQKNYLLELQRLGYGLQYTIE